MQEHDADILSDSWKKAEGWFAEKLKKQPEIKADMDHYPDIMFFNKQALAERIVRINEESDSFVRMAKMDVLKGFFLEKSFKDFFADETMNSVLHAVHAKPSVPPIVKPSWMESLLQKAGDKIHENFSGHPGMTMCRTIATYIGGFAMLDATVGLMTPKKEQPVIRDGEIVMENKNPTLQQNLAKLAIGTGTLAAGLFLDVTGKGHIR